MNEKELNPYDFGYEPDQVWATNATANLMIIDLLNQVIATQPRIFAPLMYAEKAEEIKDKYGNVLAVDTTWKEHNQNSFFMSAIQANGAIPGMTELALKCEQVKFALESMHLENIKNGIAKPITELQKKDALSNLS